MKLLDYEQITFNDVLLLPQFSGIESRANCETDTEIMGSVIRTPIISSNMDTVTEEAMANKMFELGGRGVLHRFQTIEQNIEMFKKCSLAWCSVGVGETEYNRFLGLYAAGCKNFVLDVAHGASTVALNQYVKMKKSFPNDKIYFTVGNFATSDSIKDFVKQCIKTWVSVPSAFKVGIGGGSMCTTRVVTGCGVPQLQAIIDCVSSGYPIIADGGIKNSGDYAKAMACGAKAVMLGSMLAGTEETPGDVIWTQNGPYLDYPAFKKYRGSASAESYEVQGKTASHRTAEGESGLVEYKGSVEKIIKQLQAGLRSSMSYVGAKDLTEFKERAIMIKVSNNTQLENGAHGKNL